VAEPNLSPSTLAARSPLHQSASLSRGRITSQTRKETRVDQDDVVTIEAASPGVFVVLAAAGVTATVWLLVAGYTGHGLKDSGRNAAGTWPTPGGGRRSAPPSTGSSLRSW
jgi:hypothetical protein